MKTFLITLLTASMIAALVMLLAPQGEKGGLAKHIRLLAALFMLCVLLSPLQSLIQAIKGLLSGNTQLPWEDPTVEDGYEQQMNDALQSASTSYFTQMLTQTIQSQFSIRAGEVRCEIQWQSENDALLPVCVTVILSGQAKWKDPSQIEAFVRELLGCECVSAIE